MNTRVLLRVGVAGTVVAGLCCATPIVLDVVGLSAWVRGLNYVSIPVLGTFIGLTLYAATRCRYEAACCALPSESDANASGGRP